MKVVVDPLIVARLFATWKHQGQYYQGLPYTHHLMAVEAVLRKFGPTGTRTGMLSLHSFEEMEDRVMLCAGWLHDIIEDTGTKAKEIVELFGEDVGDLVVAVTDVVAENRKARKALTYPKIREAGRFAVRLKLADRIANVEAGGKLGGMYKKEHEDFRRALYTPTENEDMWNHLNMLLADDPKLDAEGGDV